ncbi:MAG TPA: hypothetical protein VH277_05160 [Gemmatimonadaceae bacterium]|jgi:hypothetical protein|nr:hypothetical protein [Gemmatimonadaceae bacterium]
MICPHAFRRWNSSTSTSLNRAPSSHPQSGNSSQSEIRDSTDVRFPDRPRFVAMHHDHILPSPGDVARKLVDYLLSEGFGAQPVFDLRDA